MEQSGGDLAAELPKPSDDGDAGGEDSLSALPEDVVVLILLRLSTAGAVRTSDLSRRWRRIWALLPEFRFHLAPDGHRIRELLEAPEAPELRWISVTTEGTGPDSAAAWLPVAARRLTGGLVYHNVVPGNQKEEETGGRGDLLLPCFEKATAIELDLGFLGLGLMSPGVFARLTKLSLRRVRFLDPCELGDVVSSQGCPCLQKLKLKVRDSRGLHILSIHSESLLQIKLTNLGTLQELTIVAPTLQKLGATYIFSYDGESEPVANITAPQLVSLTWRDVYDQESVHLGNLGCLKRLTTSFLFVYGLHGGNHSCLSLLNRFQVLHSLNLFLIYGQDIVAFQFLMGDVTMLPQITLLHVNVLNRGHAFGASLFHLLNICIGIRRLSLLLHAHSSLEARSACPSGCICDQPTSWKTEELLLNHLEDIRICDLKGTEHEVAFLKRLINWATVLKKTTISFDYQISESKVSEFRRGLEGSFKPETSVEFYMYEDADKRSLFLLTPEDQGTGL